MLLIASAIALLPMILSDIRTREVNVLWLLLFGIIQFYFNGISNVSYNLCIVLLLLFGMYLYLIFKHGYKSKLTDYFGIGDILFLLSLTAAFPIREYIYFLIIGFIVSIVGWLLSTNKRTIPLVSTLGATYLIWLLIKIFQYE